MPLGFGAAGGAGGAVKGLQDLLEQRFMERKQAEMEAARRADDELRNRQVALDEEAAAGNRAAGQSAQAAAQEALAAIRANQNLTPEQKLVAEVNIRSGKGLPADFGKPKERTLTPIKGLRTKEGQPMTGLIDTSTGEQVSELPEFQAPEKPHALTQANSGEWVDPYDKTNLGKVMRPPPAPPTEMTRLTNEMAAQRLKDMQDAAAAKEKEAKAAAGATTEVQQAALASANKMLDPKGVGAGLRMASGAYFNTLRGMTQGAVDFNAERDRLVALLTVPNLKLLKGTMSDNDIKFLTSLSSTLPNRETSEKSTRDAIVTARNILMRSIGPGAQPEASKPGAAPAAGAGPGEWDFVPGKGLVPRGTP